MGKGLQGVGLFACKLEEVGVGWGGDGFTRRRDVFYVGYIYFI